MGRQARTRMGCQTPKPYFLAKNTNYFYDFLKVLANFANYFLLI
jgi:hypothetical protein